jgi:hypothetical protein
MFNKLINWFRNLNKDILDIYTDASMNPHESVSYGSYASIVKLKGLEYKLNGIIREKDLSKFTNIEEGVSVTGVTIHQLELIAIL